MENFNLNFPKLYNVPEKYFIIFFILLINIWRRFILRIESCICLMADIADIQQTFDSRLFVVACQDVARIVSILSFESEDVTKPRKINSIYTNTYEKLVFFMRFFYLVFYKGFTPTIFDMIPYRLWQILTIAIYIYRLTILPFWLRVTGYGKYASWTSPQIGSSQPTKDEPVTKPYKIKTSLAAESRLATVEFGDFHFEHFITVLYNKGAHLSPHSQSPGNFFAWKGCGIYWKSHNAE